MKFCNIGLCAIIIHVIFFTPSFAPSPNTGPGAKHSAFISDDHQKLMDDFAAFLCNQTTALNSQPLQQTPMDMENGTWQCDMDTMQHEGLEDSELPCDRNTSLHGTVSSEHGPVVEEASTDNQTSLADHPTSEPMLDVDEHASLLQDMNHFLCQLSTPSKEPQNRTSDSATTDKEIGLADTTGFFEDTMAPGTGQITSTPQKTSDIYDFCDDGLMSPNSFPLSSTRIVHTTQSPQNCQTDEIHQEEGMDRYDTDMESVHSLDYSRDEIQDETDIDPEEYTTVKAKSRLRAPKRKGRYFKLLVFICSM